MLTIVANEGCTNRFAEGALFALVLQSRSHLFKAIIIGHFSFFEIFLSLLEDARQIRRRFQGFRRKGKFLSLDELLHHAVERRREGNAHLFGGRLRLHLQLLISLKEYGCSIHALKYIFWYNIVKRRRRSKRPFRPRHHHRHDRKE